MSRLPQPGGDQGQWGAILNDYLAQSLDSNGLLVANSVGATQLKTSTVAQNHLNVSAAPSAGQVLSTDGTHLTWSTPSSSGSVPDATTSTKGLIQLAGDLAGTAGAPTVPGLAGKASVASVAGKADDTTVVHLAGAETITGAKNFTGGLQSAGAAVVTTSDARLTDARTPSNASVTTAKLDAVAAPTNGQILSYNGTKFNWVAAPSGGTDPVMGGDISGTASNATIIANAVVTSNITDANVTTAKIADANVTTAKIANSAITQPKIAATNSPSAGQVLSWTGSAFTWVTPSAGGGSGNYNVVNKTADYTAVEGDFVICDATNGAITITLPIPATAGSRVKVNKVDSSSNSVVIKAATGQISNQNTVTNNGQWTCTDYTTDGAKWYQG
jgi:hypothetical protein